MDLLITRRNGGQHEPYELPVLDENYPSDVNLTVIRGDSVGASFNVSITTPGVPAEYTYQWYVDGVAVDGAINATFTIRDITSTTSSTVYCEVTNKAGTIISRVAMLNVEEYYLPILNASYPSDVSLTVIRGNSVNASFNISIDTPGAPAEYTYQWYVDGVAVSGATNATFTVSNITAKTNSTIYCKVTNSAGTVTSRTAALNVEEYYLPTLNASYPSNVSLVQSSSASATFTVSISSHGNPSSYTYQWYVNGSAVSGATGSSYTKSGLSSAATYSVYCKVTNTAGTVQSRTATLTVRTYIPSYTYSGTHQLIDDGGGNWRIKLTSSGTLNFTTLESSIDVFCVGGGGGGAGGGASGSGSRGGGGGGGGYTNTGKRIAVSKGTNYSIVVGAGGSGSAWSAGGSNAGAGGSSSAFGISANGGSGGYHNSSKGQSNGGSGGSGGGAGSAARDIRNSGGTNGGNGNNSTLNDGSYGGTGQGTTTKEFAESGGTLYASGGYGGSRSGSYGLPCNAGGSNTGNGGDGANGVSSSISGNGANGGSGIVVIRNTR